MGTCGFQFDYEVKLLDSVITITQIDTAEDMTTCYGYHNFVVPVVNLPEGNYRIDIYRDCLFQDVRFIKSFWFSNTLSNIEKFDEQPNKFILYNAYPNPFNPLTKIKYEIPEYNFVVIKVYNVIGKEITTLVNEEKPGGSYQVEFNAADLASGVYYYRFSAGDFIEVKKMILVK